MKVLMVDPPSGWKYGFPKEAPENYKSWTDKELNAWLLSQGYPEKDLAIARKYSRFWEEDKTE